MPNVLQNLSEAESDALVAIWTSQYFASALAPTERYPLVHDMDELMVDLNAVKKRLITDEKQNAAFLRITIKADRALAKYKSVTFDSALVDEEELRLARSIETLRRAIGRYSGVVRPSHPLSAFVLERMGQYKKLSKAQTSKLSHLEKGGSKRTKGASQLLAKVNLEFVEILGREKAYDEHGSACEISIARFDETAKLIADTLDHADQATPSFATIKADAQASLASLKIKQEDDRKKPGQAEVLMADIARTLEIEDEQADEIYKALIKALHQAHTSNSLGSASAWIGSGL